MVSKTYKIQAQRPWAEFTVKNKKYLLPKRLRGYLGELNDALALGIARQANSKPLHALEII